MHDYAMLKNRIRENLLKQIEYRVDASDEEVLSIIEEEILVLSKDQYLPLATKNRLRMEIFHSIRKYDILQQLIEDSSVTEIMVNGISDIFIERNGKLERFHAQFESKEKLEDVIQQIVSKSNRVVNESHPIVDARLSLTDREDTEILADASCRVNVVLSPIAINGPILTIRRFPDKPIEMEDLIRMQSISIRAAEFLEKLVICKYNIFISGGTGSGKTTFLNVLSGYIPQNERIITIEDSAELKLQNIDNLVRLETRNANMEGVVPITIRDLIKSSLRMRPDRIIVGEVRGAEALDMIQAFNTGHDGSLSTGHSNSAKDMLSRLETMILMAMDLPLEAIRRQIASGVDLIVHLGRLRDRSRRILSIDEIIGYEDGEIKLQTLFEFEEQEETEDGRIIGMLVEKNPLLHTEKIKMAGCDLS